MRQFKQKIMSDVYFIIFWRVYKFFFFEQFQRKTTTQNSTTGQ